MKSLNCIWYGMCTILKLYIERNCALNLSSIFHLFTSKLSLNPFNYTISMGSSDYCVCLISLLLFSQQICQMKCVILTSNLVQMAKHQKKRPFHSSIDNSTLSCCIHENLLSYDAIAVVFVSSNYTHTQTKTSTKHRMGVKSRVRWIVWRLITVHRWEWDTALGYASWISNQNSKTSGTSSTSRTSFKPHTV